MPAAVSRGVCVCRFVRAWRVFKSSMEDCASESRTCSWYCSCFAVADALVVCCRSCCHCRRFVVVVLVIAVAVAVAVAVAAAAAVVLEVVVVVLLG